MKIRIVASRPRRFEYMNEESIRKLIGCEYEVIETFEQSYYIEYPSKCKRYTKMRVNFDEAVIVCPG